MIDLQFWTIAHAAGFLLVLGSLAFVPGGLMFWRRGGLQGRPLPSQAYFVWERCFVMAAVILTALGFVLLAEHLQNTDGRVLGRTGATAYLFAGILVVVAEALSLNGGFDKHYPLIIIYVVVALLAQAAIGASLLQAGLPAAWIGWLTIGWNLGCLVVLSLFSRRDMYFPFVYHLMPLAIGIGLLWTP
jgi:hypothetical protein